MSSLKLATFYDTAIMATQSQIDALELLSSTNGGGLATVHDYVSESGRISPETADITFISRFNYGRLNERKRAALEALSLDDIKNEIKAPKLQALSVDALQAEFDKRKAYLIESINKTASGDRSDARRQAHDRCYLRIDNGIRVHFRTVTVDGQKEPVTIDGVPVVDSVMLDAIVISKKVKVPGQYKEVNSGTQVLIGNVIESALPKSTKFRALSLVEGKFSSLSIAGQEMLPEDFKGIF